MYDVKMTIIGETEVGKTSISQYFIRETPSIYNATTPCAMFQKKTVDLDGTLVNY